MKKLFIFDKREQNEFEKAFLKNGFRKAMKDQNKQLLVLVNEKQYSFPLATNKIYHIGEYDIKMAVAINHMKDKMLFINKRLALKFSKEHTSPYRTFYKGLMKEPFKFVFPFDEDIVFETSEGLIIQAKIRTVKMH